MKAPNFTGKAVKALHKNNSPYLMACPTLNIEQKDMLNAACEAIECTFDITPFILVGSSFSLKEYYFDDRNISAVNSHLAQYYWKLVEEWDPDGNHYTLYVEPL